MHKCCFIFNRKKAFMKPYAHSTHNFRAKENRKPKFREIEIQSIASNRPHSIRNGDRLCILEKRIFETLTIQLKQKAIKQCAYENGMDLCQRAMISIFHHLIFLQSSLLIPKKASKGFHFEFNYSYGFMAFNIALLFFSYTNMNPETRHLILEFGSMSKRHIFNTTIL